MVRGAIPQLDVFKALGDNTRYAIYLELARAPQPLATADVSTSLGLHPNTVRPHLERMRDIGLVDVEVGGRGDVGRPQHRYSLAAGAPSLGLEPPTMPVLARMVLTMATRLEASGADAEAVGCAEGMSRAVPFESAPSTLEALVSDMDLLGFDPVVTDDPADGDPAAAVLAFANCPFAELAEQHPELVCGLHHGLVAGFVAEMGDMEVREFCSLTSHQPCRVTISSR